MPLARARTGRATRTWERNRVVRSKAGGLSTGARKKSRYLTLTGVECRAYSGHLSGDENAAQFSASGARAERAREVRPVHLTCPNDRDQGHFALQHPLLILLRTLAADRRHVA